MDAPAEEIVEKAIDIVEAVGAEIDRRKRTRSRPISPTVLAGLQASAGTADLSGAYLTWP